MKVKLSAQGNHYEEQDEDCVSILLLMTFRTLSPRHWNSQNVDEEYEAVLCGRRLLTNATKTCATHSEIPLCLSFKHCPSRKPRQTNLMQVLKRDGPDQMASHEGETGVSQLGLRTHWPCGICTPPCPRLCSRSEARTALRPITSTGSFLARSFRNRDKCPQTSDTNQVPPRTI